MEPSITCTADDRGTLVRVTCRLDAEGQEQLAHEIDRLLRAGEHVVRLDLAAVSFISSAGIGGLVAAHKKLKAAAGRLEVVAASPQVAGVLKLTKLDTLIGPAAVPAAPAAAAERHVERVIGDVRLVALATPGGPPLPVRVARATDGSTVVDLTAASFALGLGTPDHVAPDPAATAGELVAAAGCLFHRPPAADPRIDWVVPQGGMMAKGALLEGLAWEGVPSGAAGFEPTAGETVSIDSLARAVLAAGGGSTVGFVAVGEIHGLVGAELVRPLAEVTAADHPRAGTAAVAARWLSFFREPVHARRTALLVGVVAARSPADAMLAAALRPLWPGGDAPVGHVHAAVFDFRPVRREPGDLGELVAGLATAPPVSVMHLLADPEPLVGSGRSELHRGVVWFAPLNRVERASP